MRSRARVISNRELLEQAISNVVRNSVKYTEQGTIKLVGATQDSRIVIAVTDTGVGIPEEELPRVVERFYRADGTRDGFGLGLAIVQAAMEVLDGELGSSPASATARSSRSACRSVR